LATGDEAKSMILTSLQVTAQSSDMICHWPTFIGKAMDILEKPSSWACRLRLIAASASWFRAAVVTIIRD
jgi:hypothetical protein